MKPYYERAGITIYHGDCLEVMREMPDKSVDAVITDPPYGINYQSNMRVVTEKFQKIYGDDGTANRLRAYPEFYRLLKNDSVVASFCSFKNYAEDYTELSKTTDIKNCIVWYKHGGGIGDLAHSLLTDYELCLIGHKGARAINGKRSGSVWETNKVIPSEMLHPTEKPVEILGKLINSFTCEGETILDPFMGSGTTLVAAKQLGRKAIGIEISEKYCEIAVKRLAQEVMELT